MKIEPVLIYEHEPLFSLENLYRAYRLCRRRKRKTHNAMLFEQNLEENLLDLRQQLMTGTYQPKRSVAFMVKKPKRREIFAADFSDRVMHHLLVGYLEPQWEKRFIFDSFACRKNKGTLAAVERLTDFSRKITANNSRKVYYLQLDIRGFFININRHILYQRLQIKENNPAILWLIRQVLLNRPTKNCLLKGSLYSFLSLPAHKTLFKAKKQCGLPIGNLSSQFFANVYLDALDQFVKHQLKARYYVRYCDDFIVLSQHREELEQFKQAIKYFLQHSLTLELNPRQKLQAIQNGMNFLGYIIRPNYRLVRNRVIGNLYERLYKAEQQLQTKGMKSTVSGVIVPWDWSLISNVQQTLNSYMAHFSKANSFSLVQKIIHRFSWLACFFIQGKQKKSAKNHQIVLCLRYPPGRYFQSLKQQIHYFLHRLNDHICVFEVGNQYLVYNKSHLPPGLSSLASLSNSRKLKVQGFCEIAIHYQKSLSDLKHYLWNLHSHTHQNITWITQTGDWTGNVLERKMSTQWLGGSFHTTPLVSATNCK